MKKLYYVVEKDLYSEDDNTDQELTTGNKDIFMYKIVDGELELIGVISCDNIDNSLEMVKENLEMIGYDIDLFNYIQL